MSSAYLKYVSIAYLKTFIYTYWNDIAALCRRPQKQDIEKRIFTKVVQFRTLLHTLYDKMKCLDTSIKWIIDKRSIIYSLSDPNLAHRFFLFLVTKTCVPSIFDKHLMSAESYINIPTFFLSSLKRWFRSLVPIVKFHWRSFTFSRSTMVSFLYYCVLLKHNTHPPISLYLKWRSYASIGWLRFTIEWCSAMWHPCGTCILLLLMKSSLPPSSGRWFPLGFALRKTILPRGSIPSGYPHWDVISVYYISNVNVFFLAVLYSGGNHTPRTDRAHRCHLYNECTGGYSLNLCIYC